MGIKTFNINEKVHKDYSSHCKKEGISMSKKVENFIKSELDKIDKMEKSAKKEKEVQPSLKNPPAEYLQSSPEKDPSKEDNSFRKYC